MTSLRGRRYGSRRRGRLLGLLIVGALVAPSSGVAVAQSTAAPVNDPRFDLQHHLQLIRAPEAWEITTGDPEVVIAVIDTGVSPFHPDLDGALWRAASGAHGYDYVRDTTSTFLSGKQDWHGSAVAGIAAARADDGVGTAGVAPNVSVMVRRIYSSQDALTPPRIEGVGVFEAVRAINDSVDDGADVILLSWGYDQLPLTQRNLLRRTIADAGVPVVAAAGNDGHNLSASGTGPYPAKFSGLSNLVTVTASDSDHELWDDPEFGSANYGYDTVDLAAPGDGIWAPDVAFQGDQYWPFVGSSFSAPQVAAALALGRTLAPGMGAAELVSELLRSVRRQDALVGKVFSGGVLDVAEFLSNIERPACTPERVAEEAGFVDVPTSSVHAFNIGCIAYWGVTVGTSPDRFSPGQDITRGQMASFLSRILDVTGDTSGLDAPDEFVDDDGTVHEAAINRLAELGIAEGLGDDHFGPVAPVTRGQMAAFLVRTFEYITGRSDTLVRDWFDDATGVHGGAVLASREHGIAFGTAAPRTFDPGSVTRRDHMASFVARTLDALRREGVALTPRVEPEPEPESEPDPDAEPTPDEEPTPAGDAPTTDAS